MHIGHILFTAIVSAAVLCTLPAGGAFAEPGRLTLTAETPDLKSLTLRAVVRYQVITAFCVYKQDELSSFGFSTPFSVLGSVIHTGLLREIRNPLAYSAASSVFREKSDIRLTTSLDGSAYWGLVLRPLPKSLVLYYYGKKDETFSLGAVARLEWEKIARLEMLVSTSYPRTPEQSAAWFKDKPPFPGGRLVHAASRLKLGWSPMYAIVSGGFSCGLLVQPGYFIHTISGLETRPLDLFLIIGYDDPHYLDPEAGCPKRNFMYGGSFALDPFDWLELDGGYRRTVEHGYLQQGNRRNSSEELDSGLKVTAGIGPRSTIYAETGYTAHFYYPADARDYLTHTLSARITCDADGQSFSAWLSLKNPGLSDQSSTIGIEFELQNAFADLVVALKRTREDSSAWYNFRAAFYLLFPNQKYYIRLNTKRELDQEEIDWRTFRDEFTRYFCFTLGWEGAW